MAQLTSAQWRAMLDAASDVEKTHLQVLLDAALRREEETEKERKEELLKHQESILATIPSLSNEQCGEQLQSILAAFFQVRKLEDHTKQFAEVFDELKKLRDELTDMTGKYLGADSVAVGNNSEAGNSATAAAQGPEPAAVGPSRSDSYVDRKAVQIPSKYDGKEDVESWISSMRAYFEVLGTQLETQSVGMNVEPMVRGFLEVQAIRDGVPKIEVATIEELLINQYKDPHAAAKVRGQLDKIKRSKWVGTMKSLQTYLSKMFATPGLELTDQSCLDVVKGAVPTNYTNRLGRDFIDYTDWFVLMKDIVSLEAADLVTAAGSKKPTGGRRFKGSSRFAVHDLLEREEEAEADDPTLGDDKEQDADTACLEPEATKVEVIRDWPQPANVRELRSFLGLASYYRKFVPRFSIIAHPLSRLTSKNVPYTWDDACTSAFAALKEALVSCPVLRIADPKLPFVVTTDASRYGIGAVLQQDDGDGLRPLEYYSKRMPSVKVATSTYMRKLYALRTALDHWKHYLLGRHFKVFSDHETLKWIKMQTTLSPTLLRWFHEIDIFDFELRHKKGCYNRVADALSRHPEHMTCLVKSYDLRKKLKEELVEQTAKDSELGPIPEQLRADPSSQSDFHEHGGLVFCRNGNHDRLCVPNHEPLRTHFLDLAHGRSGHFSMAKTYANLLRQFDWPGMKGTAEKFVAECQVCQRIKPCRQKPMGLLTPLPIPDGPGESVSVDFTDMGKFGAPKTLVSDRDPRFISIEWKDFTSQLGIRLCMTSSRHPETNGLAEEINQTVFQLLCALIIPDQETWDEELYSVKGLYNNSVHSATGMTPNRLQYGWQIRNPLSYLFPEQPASLTPGRPGFKAKYDRLLKVAVAAMTKRQHAMIHHANKRRRPSNIEGHNKKEHCTIQNVAENRAPHVAEKAASDRKTIRAIRPLVPVRYRRKFGECQVATGVSFAIPTIRDQRTLAKAIKEGISEDFPSGVFRIPPSFAENPEETDQDPDSAKSFEPILIKMEEKARLCEGLVWRAWNTATTLPYSTLAGKMWPAEVMADSLATIIKSHILSMEHSLWDEAMPLYVEPEDNDGSRGEDDDDILADRIPLDNAETGTTPAPEGSMGKYSLGSTVEKRDN
ncbi:hypothetical protein CBR_g12319 [Chara braunii]|uniref:Integrase catalytic domain-containing protein n=1 Tax=Chara braunii TaxID=69332 RepID=A0A388KRQ8_CHABU|nr:hypothetical protein CBR_g12319 [Chara braunii]|eukprot:GBG72751.1 hypothetical protein CBR_g12319 [Chara braunii]